LGLSWYAHAGRYGLRKSRSGASVEDIMEWFDLTREQVTAVLDFASQRTVRPEVMEAFRRSNEKFRDLYRKLAE
jgi:copper oxidase (laccase) domain-containing protein